MKTKIGFILLMIGLFFTSCNNKFKTYPEMKKDQKKAINKVIVEKNIEVISDYPKNGVFKENQFVKLDNGVYLHVIDSGNGNRPVSGKTIILMRCSVEHIFGNDTGKIDLFNSGLDPIEFTYGNANVDMNQFYLSDPSFYYYGTCYLSTGVESALNYVGENALVKLIVPFEVGSPYQSTRKSIGYGAPLYYEKVRFTFYN